MGEGGEINKLIFFCGGSRLKFFYHIFQPIMIDFGRYWFKIKLNWAFLPTKP